MLGWLFSAQTASAIFYESSQRVSANQGKGEDRFLTPQARHVVQLFDHGAAGFYLANDARRPLVMTCRHTFKIPDQFATLEEYFASGTLRCWDLVLREYRRVVRLVFSSPDTDFLILELSGDYPGDGFVLTSSPARPGDRVQMYGFPKDKYKLRGLNLTQNAWILEGEVTPDKLPPSQRVLGDRAIYNNCSTWAGNSGGPIVLEGTNVALGMPAIYYVERENRMHSSRPGQGNTDPKGAMLDISHFVATRGDVIRRYGIHTVSRSERPRPQPHHSITLLPGIYESTATPGVFLGIKPVYNTSPAPVHVDFWFQRDSHPWVPANTHRAVAKIENGLLLCTSPVLNFESPADQPDLLNVRNAQGDATSFRLRPPGLW